jgi:ring-1,2-phenylacetyl-CoA epoxidase subunit PaaE
MSLSVDQLTRPLKISKRVQETSDSVSIAFEIPEVLKKDFRYTAGQFVTLFLDINGEQINRSYSLCTSPLMDGDFKIMVKKVTNGRASTFLTEKAKVGDVLKITPPAGHFFKPTIDTTHFHMFAAGSGITPVLSILKTVLAVNNEHQVTLGYANRNEESIIFKKELEELQTKFTPKRLQIVHLLSQPSSAWTSHKGRTSTDWIRKVLETKNPKLKQAHYLCGPDGFMEGVRNSLLEIGINKNDLHEESFAVGLQPKTHAAAPTLKEDWTYVGDKSQAQEKSGGKLVAMVSGDVVECDVKPDQSILEALIEAGANPPYSCMDGACMACLAKVQEGLVYQTDPGILSDENIENRETLTCQARVLSRTVKVSYDDI